MNTNTNNTTKKASRPAGFTKFDWESKTLRVFNGLVRLVDKKDITFDTFKNHPIVKELLSKICNANTPEDRDRLVLSLIIDACHYCTKDGELVMKVKCIGSVRKWFNGGWSDKINRKVVYKEPKAPTAPKAKKASPKGKKSEVKKVKNVSVAQWVKGLTPEQVDALKVEIAARDMDLENVA